MRKIEQICARVTPDDMAALREWAARQEMLLSEFIRRTLAEKLTQLKTGEDGNEAVGPSQHRQPSVQFLYRYR
jgi:hypothetical protein